MKTKSKEKLEQIHKELYSEVDKLLSLCEKEDIQALNRKFLSLVLEEKQDIANGLVYTEKVQIVEIENKIYLKLVVTITDPPSPPSAYASQLQALSRHIAGVRVDDLQTYSKVLNEFSVENTKFLSKNSSKIITILKEYEEEQEAKYNEVLENLSKSELENI